MREIFKKNFIVHKIEKGAGSIAAPFVGGAEGATHY